MPYPRVIPHNEWSLKQRVWCFSAQSYWILGTAAAESLRG